MLRSSRLEVSNTKFEDKYCFTEGLLLAGVAVGFTSHNNIESGLHLRVPFFFAILLGAGSTRSRMDTSVSCTNIYRCQILVIRTCIHVAVRNVPAAEDHAVCT